MQNALPLREALFAEPGERLHQIGPVFSIGKKKLCCGRRPSASTNAMRARIPVTQRATRRRPSSSDALPYSGSK